MSAGGHRWRWRATWQAHGSGGEGARASGGGSPDSHFASTPHGDSSVGERVESTHTFRDVGDRGGAEQEGPPSGVQGHGHIFMPDGHPGANIDARIADDSDKALLASIRASRPRPDSLRPDFGTSGIEIKLRTNFFPVRVSHVPFYDYDVAIVPSMEYILFRVQRRILRLAEQTDAWRQAGMSGKVVSDGRARLISAIRLPQPLTIAVPYYDERERGPPGHLSRYLAGDVSHHNYNVSPIINTLNIILTSISRRVDISLGRNRYFSHTTGEPFRLEGGFEVRKGFYSSVRPVYKQLMVGVSVRTTTFYSPGNLARAMMEFRDASFSAYENSIFRGLRIRTHLGSWRIVKRVVPHTARTLSFDTPEYGPVTLEEYFRLKYNIRLQYPNLQLIEIGGQTPSYLPAEVCDIPSGQPLRKIPTELDTQIKTVTRRTPRENGASIVNHGNQLGLDVTGPELRSFGITIGQDMAVVPGRILPKPGIKYLSSAASVDDQASWNLRGVEFAVGARLEKWAVLLIKDGWEDEIVDSSDQNLHWAVARFHNVCNVSGMHVADDPTYVTAQLPPRDPSDPLRQRAMASIKTTLLGVNPKPTLFLVVLANGNKAVYEGLKRLCDISLDITTVCVQSSKFRKSNLHYLANVALKVNMKLGGINHRIDSDSKKWLNSVPTMIVGICVAHPSPGSTAGTPSIVAVVATVDSDFAQYPAALEMQTSKVEMVMNLGSMMISRLKLFQKKNNGMLPERIIIYRRGVSEGQFEVMRSNESALMLEAFHAFDSENTRYRPRLAIILCSKRNQVRFYPTDGNSAGRDGNPLPGTVIDRGITAIYGFDFFLQSHGGSPGTAHPVHYHVKHDEIGFSADEVQNLTNSLSYMCARTTKAVRLASPAHYAEAASQRGRCYLRKLFHGYLGDGASGALNQSDSGQEVWQEAQKLWGGGVSKAGLKDTMFYL